MNTLQIHITSETLKDYNDQDENIKIARACINDVCTKLCESYEDTVSDADIKTDVKNKLTNLGFTWDTEI